MRHWFKYGDGGRSDLGDTSETCSGRGRPSGATRSGERPAIRVGRKRDQVNRHGMVVRGTIEAVKTIPIRKTGHQMPKDDPHYPAAVERAKEAARRLRAAAIIDAEGRRIRKDLPPDMQESQDRDFGG